MASHACLRKNRFRKWLLSPSAVSVGVDILLRQTVNGGREHSIEVSKRYIGKVPQGLCHSKPEEQVALGTAAQSVSTLLVASFNTIPISCASKVRM